MRIPCTGFGFEVLLFYAWMNMVAATIMLHNELPTKCEHVCRNEMQGFGSWKNDLP